MQNKYAFLDRERSWEIKYYAPSVTSLQDTKTNIISFEFALGLVNLQVTENCMSKIWKRDLKSFKKILKVSSSIMSTIVALV